MKFNSNMFFLAGVVMLSASVILASLFFIVFSGVELSLEWEIFSCSSWCVMVLGLADFMSVIFLSTVLMISGSVMIFSSSYMSGDKFSPRFGALVISFVMSMALLILSPNLVSLLLGWDGLGVTSYLLVCYYSSEKSFNASMLTALTNRVGDVAILLGIGVGASLGLYNYGLISSSNFGGGGLFFILVILAAMTKSAQIPFSSWLPAAMAAPTPVSALVHSSTLVTAGVYLLIRFNYSILGAGANSILLMLGGATMLMAGGAALLELDMKKVIALSTLSQLGVMFFSLGLGQTFFSFYHLVSHAYFKAMLFMAAGAMIHSLKDYQDLRKMGGSGGNTLIMASIMMVANLSLCGLPFLSGFYSKDLILELFLFGDKSCVIFFVAVGATLLTALYSIRFSLGLFGGQVKREPFSGETEGDVCMVAGVIILVGPSVMGGWWLAGLFSCAPMIWLPLWQKLLILSSVLLVGMWLVFSGANLMPANAQLKLVHQMWFMPLLFSPASTQLALKSAKGALKFTDLSWIVFLTWKWGVSNTNAALFSTNLFRASLLASGVFFISASGILA